jgi:site-specific recombinase XerD
MNGHVILTDSLLNIEAKLCSEDTLDSFQRMLTPFIESLQIDDITSQDVRRFLAGVAKRGVSSTTVHTHAWSNKPILDVKWN